MARRPFSRRTALVGALVAPAAAAACDIDPPQDPGSSAAPGDSPTGDGTDDVDLVADVLAGIETTMAVVAAAAARPASADLAARLTVLHEAQAAVLGGAVPDGTTTDDPTQGGSGEGPGDAPTGSGAGAGLVPAERALQRLLVRSAAAARSGDLARVLASAAAAVAQELAVADLGRARP